MTQERTLYIQEDGYGGMQISDYHNSGYAYSFPALTDGMRLTVQWTEDNYVTYKNWIYIKSKSKGRLV